MEFTKEKCLELYTQLSFSRAYETVLKDCAESGKLPGMCHPAFGQEGFFVGVQAAMQPEDWLSPQWRGDAQFCLRMGAKEFTTEMLGKANGPSGGLAGSDHIYSAEAKVGLMSGYLGQGVALGFGTALAYKLQKRPGCVFVGIGDGEMNEGAISEILNMAAIYKLPLVIYIHNNGFGFSADYHKMNAIPTMAKRADGFGLPNKTISGTNVMEIIDVFEDAREKACKGEPSVIEIVTTRWQGHFVGDGDLYRDEDLVKTERELTDPVKFFRNYILKKGYADEAELDKIDKEQMDYSNEVFEFGFNSPDKTKEDVTNLDLVYAD